MVSHQLFSLTNLNLAHPGRKKLAALAVLVLTVHLWLLLSSGDSLWRLHSESQKLGPLQTRVVAPLLPATPAPSKAAPENHRPPLKKPRHNQGYGAVLRYKQQALLSGQRMDIGHQILQCLIVGQGFGHGRHLLASGISRVCTARTRAVFLQLF